MNTGMDKVLSRVDFERMRAFIRERCGIWLGDEKAGFLASRLRLRMNATGMTSVRDYHFYLRYDAEGAEEERRFIDSITNNESYFFREMDQLADFYEEVVPMLMRRRALGAPLYIWSAGCACGEEPYTLAMLLPDELWERGIPPVRILAADVNGSVLDRAQKGAYGAHALRHTPPYFRQKHFRQDGNGTYVLESRIRNMVQFARFSLLEGPIAAPFREVDAVFCRNVLIYFDDETKKKCIENIYRRLKKGGFLFLGLSESLTRITSLFEPVRLKRTVVYRKPEALDL